MRLPEDIRTFCSVLVRSGLCLYTDHAAQLKQILIYMTSYTLLFYRTIPIAKRRYYGRVQQAVHEFLEMGTLIVKGDLSNPIVSTFFDVNGIVVVEAKRKDVNGQCTKKDNECKGREIRDSRWNDMKASMYLLGNAFRTDQQKPPDRLRTCGRFGQSYSFPFRFCKSHFLFNHSWYAKSYGQGGTSIF